MVAKKKKFEDCGHTGYGKHCHFCEQVEKEILIKRGNKYIFNRK